jgi:hypothetical protein
MATARPGPIVADIRGKLGPTVWSRNHAGLYVRAYAHGNHPGTPWQLPWRTAFGFLTNAYSTLLTPEQRRTWEDYAKSWPLNTKLPTSAKRTGHQAFIACNLYTTLANNEPQYWTAPTRPPIPPWTFQLRATSVPQDLLVYDWHPSTDDPRGEITLWAFSGQVLSPARNYYRGPYRYAEMDWADSPYLWPQWSVIPRYTLVTGKRTWIAIAAQHEPTGAISPPHVRSCIIEYD